MSAPKSAPPALFDLFLGFAQIAVSAFGGALPWARRIVVEDRGWLAADEFTDLLALCQFLPGPNVVNLSIAVGARFRGAAGSFAALLGLMLAPLVLIITFGLLYLRFGQIDSLRGVFSALGASAAGLVIATAAKMAEPFVRARPITAVPIIVAAFVLAGLMGWPLPLVLAVLAPISIALAWRVRT